jgi:peptidyl-prolyl cis-trans isomerase C
VLTAGAGAHIAAAAHAALPTDAAFRIAGVVTTQQQLASRVQLLKALYGVQPPKDPTGADRFTRDTAKAVAVSDVIERKAREAGIVIPEKAAQDQLDRLVAQAYPGGRNDFIARVGQVGLSEPNILGEIKRQIANSRLFEEVTHAVPEATEPDIQRAYDARRNEMVDPEKRHLRNIVVGSEAEALQILARLNAHEDFAAVARTASLDGSTKDKGGDIGTLTRDELDPRYADAAFRAGPNSHFGPVQTQNGWNIGQVFEISPAVPLSLDQVRNPLRQKLNEERKLERWDTWLGQQIRAAKVEYAPQYRPADPDEAPGGSP